MSSADAEKGADMTQQCTQWVCERSVRGYLGSAGAELGADTNISGSAREVWGYLSSADADTKSTGSVREV